MAACQDKPLVSENVNDQPVATSEASKGVNEVTTNFPCVSKHTINKSPPVQDKSKIKAMLLKSGKITPEMTDEQADKVVNDFIRAKQTPKNTCK